MGRLSSIFIAICMAVIAGSIGATLYLQFGLNGTESVIITLVVLLALAVWNVVTTRLRENEAGNDVGNLARGIADLARQVTELNRRVAAIEGRAQAAVEKTL